jgi:hypothetical protein
VVIFCAVAEVPTKVVNTDIDVMTTPMTSNIPPSRVSIIVNGIFIIDQQTNSKVFCYSSNRGIDKGNIWKPLACFCLARDLSHTSILYYCHIIREGNI